MYVCIHAPDAGALARSFSPWVEIVDSSTAVFAVTPRQLATIPPSIPMAVASTIEAAILAARNFPGQTILSPGEEARLLGSLSIDCLPPDPEIFQTLDRWGIHSLEEIARLPEDGLVGRLGPRGLWLQKLARGTLDRPLRPEALETVCEESAEMDDPIKLREPLLFLIGRFLFDLTAKLRAQSLAAGVLNLKLNKQERKLSLPFPTRDIKFLLKLVEHSLERQPPDEPVDLVRLRIEPVAPRRDATRPVHAGRAGTGKIGADAGKDSRSGGRGERAVSQIGGHASAGLWRKRCAASRIPLLPSASGGSRGGPGWHAQAGLDASGPGADSE